MFQGPSGTHSVHSAALRLWLRVEGSLPLPRLHAPSSSFLPRPLHIAARNGLASVVQALLSRGATVLAVDEEGGWGLEPSALPGFGVRDVLQEVTS